jgi:hypothetical protein
VVIIQEFLIQIKSLGFKLVLWFNKQMVQALRVV